MPVPNNYFDSVINSKDVSAALTSYRSNESYWLNSTMNSKEELKSRLIFADTYESEFQKIAERVEAYETVDGKGFNNPEMQNLLKEKNLWEPMKDYLQLKAMKEDQKALIVEAKDRTYAQVNYINRVEQNQNEYNFRKNITELYDDEEFKSALITEPAPSNPDFDAITNQQRGLRDIRKWMYRNAPQQAFEGKYLGSDGSKHAFVNNFMKQPVSVQLNTFYNVENKTRKIDDPDGVIAYESQKNYTPNLDNFKDQMIASKFLAYKRFAGDHIYWNKITEGLNKATPNKEKLVSFQKTGKGLEPKKNPVADKQLTEKEMEDMNSVLGLWENIQSAKEEIKKDPRKEQELSTQILKDAEKIRKITKKASKSVAKDNIKEFTGDTNTTYTKYYKTMDNLYKAFNLSSKDKNKSFLQAILSASGKDLSDTKTSILGTGLDGTKKVIEGVTGKKTWDSEAVNAKAGKIEGTLFSTAGTVTNAIGFFNALKSIKDSKSTERLDRIENTMTAATSGAWTAVNAYNMIDNGAGVIGKKIPYADNIKAISGHVGFWAHVTDTVKNGWQTIRNRLQQRALKKSKTHTLEDIASVKNPEAKKALKKIARATSAKKASTKAKVACAGVATVIGAASAVAAMPALGAGAAIGSVVGTVGIVAKKAFDYRKQMKETNKAVDQQLLKDKVENDAINPDATEAENNMRIHDAYYDINGNKKRTIDIQLEKHKNNLEAKRARFAEGSKQYKDIRLNDDKSLKHMIRTEACVENNSNGMKDYFNKSQASAVSDAYKSILLDANGKLVDYRTKEEYKEHHLGMDRNGNAIQGQTDEQKVRFNFYQFLKAQGKSVDFQDRHGNVKKKKLEKLAKDANVKPKEDNLGLGM